LASGYAQARWGEDFGELNPARIRRGRCVAGAHNFLRAPAQTQNDLIPCHPQVHAEIVGVIVYRSKLRPMIARRFDRDPESSSLPRIDVELTNEIALFRELHYLTWLVHCIAITIIVIRSPLGASTNANGPRKWLSLKITVPVPFAGGALLIPAVGTAKISLSAVDAT
jgi:hypothetical protein